MIIQDIREHLTKYLNSAVFSYGRAFDTALASANIEIDEWFIHLDPITYEGTLNNSTESVKLSMGFLKQDAPDSNYDDAENLDINQSIESIQQDAKTTAINWLIDFLDNYKYSDSLFTITPVTRVKNVMSGALLNVTLSYKRSC